MRSRNIFSRKVSPTLTTSNVNHSMLKCKGAGHWRVVWISIRNTHGTTTVTGNLELIHKGLTLVLDHTGTIAGYGIKVWNDDIFLSDGDELRFRVKASTGVMVADMVIQALHFSDR